MFKINFKTIFFALGLIIILFINIITLQILFQRYEAFSENPLLYGLKIYDGNNCSCYTNKGYNFKFNQTAIWQERNIDKVNYSFVNISQFIINNNE